MGLSMIPFDASTVLADRREMRAAGDKGDVRPGRGGRGAVRSTDAARADHRDAHAPLLCQAEWDATEHLSDDAGESSRRR
jgi:hypothetical protein